METNLFLELSIFFFAALLGYFIATRMGQSAVIGEIFIGILIGPSLLHLVSYSEIIKVLGEIGAVFLLFAIGLELKFNEVFDFRNGIIAFFGVITPFAMGYGVSSLFGFSTIQGLLIGTSLAATSIAISAKILQDMGKLETRAAKAIIGAAVVDDVLSLLLLSVTMGVASSGVSFSSIAYKSILAVGFIGGGYLLRPVMVKLMQKMDRWAIKTNNAKVTLILAVSLAFLYSAIAEIIGLSGIIGAFLAGITLESLAIKSYKEGAQYLEMVFAAIFFVSLGILLDFSGFHFSSIYFIIALVLVAVASKLIGCFIPAYFLKFNMRDSLIIGVGMVPRGEVAAIVGLLAMTAGLITQEVYIAILCMALFTTIAIPFFYSILFKKTKGLSS